MKAHHAPSNAAGFSLVEVMVASAVLGIVMAILLGTLTTSIALWRNSENKLAADREGRAGELLISQDLANAVVPAASALWPRVITSGGVTYLQFLTTKPLDYQREDEGDVGDVCFVEYSISPDVPALYRSFNGSAWTYANVLQGGAFPSPSSGSPQLLSTNLLADSRDSVRGLALYNEASTNSFIVLATNNPGQAGNLLPIDGAVTANNPPVAIEVNLAAADADALANQDLLANPNYKLRNAGYYSFRIALPKPAQ